MPGRRGASSSGVAPPPQKRRKQLGKHVPPLPPKVADEDVEISDEDIEFVREHQDYAGFLANLDTKPITRQILGLKDHGEGDDDLERFYEKVGTARDKGTTRRFSVDAADVLPVKTLGGELRFRSISTEDPVDGTTVSLEERRALVRKSMGSHLSGESDPTAPTRLPDQDVEGKEEKKTKAERRKEAKQLKKKEMLLKKQEEKALRQQSLPHGAEQDLEVLEEPISAEERAAQLRFQMAEICTGLLADPSSNVMTLKELLDMCTDRDESISQLAILSSMAIFKDLIPGYRIRLPAGKEAEVTVSKEVRQLRDYETGLLRFYQSYIQIIIRCAKIRSMRWTALKCLCGLLEAVPHFNYRESLLSAIVPRMGSEDDSCSNMCREAISALFKNPGKHGGEATVEAVQLIADFVRLRNCQIRPEVIKVFLDLSFDDDLLKDSSSEAATGGKKKEKVPKLSNRQEKKVKKAVKRELASQLRKEVQSDFKEASATPEVVARRKIQTLTLSSLFETYFRILKTSLEPPRQRASALGEPEKHISKSDYGLRPLLKSCLEGMGKFSHLINVDFVPDILEVLNTLAKGGKIAPDSFDSAISVWERMQCCTVAFRIVRINLDALNTDLREFYVIFYNLLLQAILSREGEDSGETLAQAFQVILWEGRHTDMRRVAAFVKRLATLALHLGPGEAMAALLTVQHLLVRYKRCRTLLEDEPGDIGGGSKMNVLPFEDEDPDLSESISSMLWELTLLSQHYHPEISKYATVLRDMNKSSSMVLPTSTPTQALKEYGSILPSVATPAKGRRKQQRKFKNKPPLSDFMKSLEEKSTIKGNGHLASRGDTIDSKTLFTNHFKFLRACRKKL